jgi:hypothetical protein
MCIYSSLSQLRTLNVQAAVINPENVSCVYIHPCLSSGTLNVQAEVVNPENVSCVYIHPCLSSGPSMSRLQ